MLSLAVVLRRSALGSICVAGAAATAMAQPPPQAECPQKQAGQECPEPAQPTAEEPQAAEPMAQPEPEAQPMDQTQPQPSYTQVTVTEEPEYEDPLTRYGIALALGGGVSGFTNETMRDTTNVGGSWGVRATFGKNYPIAFEAEYFGSAQSIDALGLDDDAILVGNGLQGLARVNILEYEFQPYVFGGLAWRYYSLARDDFNTSDIQNNDNVMEVPVGGGFAWTYRGFMLDVRGEYRRSFFDDMVPEFVVTGNAIDTDGAGMHRWGAFGSVGYAF